MRSFIDYLIESMRLVKEEEEIQSIKKAAELTTTAHLACMSELDTAKNERDIRSRTFLFF